MSSEAAKAAEKILVPCFDMFAMDVGFQCQRRMTQEAAETIQQAIDIEKSAATAENERLRELLLSCREFAFSAVRANVDIEGFDPASHVLIKEIDETLKTDDT